MIARFVILFLSGSTTELELEARTLKAEGPRGSELTWERERIGGLRLREDGWHLVGPGGELGPQCYASARSAIQAHLQGRAYELAGRLAP